MGAKIYIFQARQFEFDEFINSNISADRRKNVYKICYQVAKMKLEKKNWTYYSRYCIDV